MSNKILFFLAFISFQSLAQTTDYKDFKTKFLKEQTIFSKGNGIEKDSAHYYTFSNPKDSNFTIASVFTKAPNYSVRKDYDISKKRKNYYRDSTYYVKNKLRARFNYGFDSNLPQPNDTIILTYYNIEYLNKWNSADSTKTLTTFASYTGNIFTSIDYTYDKNINNYNANGDLMSSISSTSKDKKNYTFTGSSISIRKPDGTLLKAVRKSATGAIDTVLYSYPTNKSVTLTYKSFNNVTRKEILTYLDVAKTYITSVKNYSFNTSTQSFDLSFSLLIDYDNKSNILKVISYSGNFSSKEESKYNACNKTQSSIYSQQANPQTPYNVSQKIYYFSYCTTDVADAQKEIQNINVFPNPVSDELHFLFTEENDALKNISIYDISGKQVLSEKTRNNSINVEKLEKGSYFIKINSEMKQYRSKFFVF